MNLNPTQNSIEKKEIEPLEEDEGKEEIEGVTKSYRIFVNLPTLKMQKDVKLKKEATLEDAICSVINLDSPKFKDVNINDLEVFLATPSGEIDDDCPALEMSQIIAHVNFDKFVIVLKNSEPNEDDQPEEEEEVFCYCFKRKKKQEDVYVKLD
jgi:hypothetical protein